MEPLDQPLANGDEATTSDGCVCACNCAQCRPEAQFDDAKHPFRGEIALCLSGGGYRAASFHLGMLQCLHDLGLLERVRIVSALSGGAIISASHAIAQSKGTLFPEFRQQFETALRSNNAMAKGFEDLPSSGSGDQPPSLIRSVANAYAQDNFIGPTRFGEITQSKAIADDLVFNATEFQKGLSFRFQHSRRASFFVGNKGKLKVPQHIADDIRVADIVAASSCFPAAFEPMIFPHDFSWTRPLEEICAELSEELAKGIPLMDGGIYDNQAVDGTLTAYNRKDMKAGLVLVSDTSARARQFYQPPERVKRGGLKLKTLHKIGIAFFFGSLVSTSALLTRVAAELQEGTFNLLDAAIYGLPVLICLGLALGLWRFKRRLVIELERVEQDTEVELWDNIKHIPVLDFIDLLNARVRSLISLTSDVFMKRVRGLIATSLHVGPPYRNRVILNQIYDLDGRNRSIYKQEPWLKPSDRSKQLARRTEAMPSVLWFTEPQQLDDLVRCGELTTYFSLLEYLLTQQEAELEDQTSPERELFERAKAKYVELNS